MTPSPGLNWTVSGRRLSRCRIPLLMGILNVTPDSFSDGGQHNRLDAAVEHGLKLVADGADILDIGGESTRPGSAAIPLDEELRRTIPAIERLAKQVSVPISIDTTKAEVARQALDAGATIVNDISGLSFDPDMLDVCRRSTAGLCLMHIQGTPQTMQTDPHYENVVAEVSQSLGGVLTMCLDAGIDAQRICLDPGIGFGKTAQHNLELLTSVELLRQQWSRPVLVGHSRKRFLSKLLGRKVDELLSGTIGVSIALAQRGVDILRIHDVREVRDALISWDTILNPPAAAGLQESERSPLC